jgi:hypothetical protein
MKALLLFMSLMGCAAGRQYKCTVDNSEAGQQTVECRRGRWDTVSCTKFRRDDGTLFEHCQDSDGNVWECEYSKDDSRKVCSAR